MVKPRHTFPGTSGGVKTLTWNRWNGAAKNGWSAFLARSRLWSWLQRTHNAARPGDPQLSAIADDPSVRDDQFRQQWAARQVNIRTAGLKKLHQLVGELTLDWSALTCATDPDQQIIIWTADPGTPTHDALRMLASWAAHEQRLTDKPTGSGQR
jgi:hypothetical protein